MCRRCVPSLRPSHQFYCSHASSWTSMGNLEYSILHKIVTIIFDCLDFKYANFVFLFSFVQSARSVLQQQASPSAAKSKLQSRAQCQTKGRLPASVTPFALTPLLGTYPQRLDQCRRPHRHSPSSVLPTPLHIEIRMIGQCSWGKLQI